MGGRTSTWLPFLPLPVLQGRRKRHAGLFFSLPPWSFSRSKSDVREYRILAYRLNEVGVCLHTRMWRHTEEPSFGIDSVKFSIIRQVYPCDVIAHCENFEPIIVTLWWFEHRQICLATCARKGTCNVFHYAFSIFNAHY